MVFFNQFNFVLQSKYSVNLVEYYDYPNNRGAIYRTKNGVDSGWIYNFKNYESYLIVGKFAPVLQKLYW